MNRPEDKFFSYRADIDGLRAIAVLGVLGFHFFPEHIRGGFVGVDIFFVISGYLVTGTIYKNLISHQFLFENFYIKRVRRIFPSLIVVLIFNLMAGIVLLLSDELKSLGKHMVGGVGFFSNFLLYFESGYFEKSTDLKPLLHLWSLAIEEQFYLIWPVVIWIVFKVSRPFLKLALVGIFIISLSSNFYWSEINQPLSFYMLPTRLWELALGGLLVFAEKTKTIDRIKKLNMGFSLLGFLIILFSYRLITKLHLFPGFWVLLPTIGTALIILDSPNGVLNRLLSFKHIVYIGLISYPLYLWHWPLLSFANIVFSQTIPTYMMLVVPALSFLLAVVTYEFIEKPIRRMKISLKLTSTLCLILFFVGFAGYLMIALDGFPGRYPQYENVRQTKTEFIPTEADEEAKKCMQNFLSIEMCAVAKLEAPPTVLLTGDSHATHLYPGLKKIYDKKGDNLLSLAKSGTPPFYKIKSKRNPDTSFDEVFEFLIKTPSIHTVILSAFWMTYYEEFGAEIPEGKYKNTLVDVDNLNQKNQNLVFINSLLRTIKLLHQHNRKIILIYDIPTLPFELDKCIPRPLIKGAGVDCSFDLKPVMLKQMGYRNAIKSALKEDHKTKILDLVPVLCENSWCSVFKNNKMIYTDSDHLSIEGAYWLFDRLEREFIN